MHPHSVFSWFFLYVTIVGHHVGPTNENKISFGVLHSHKLDRIDLMNDLYIQRYNQTQHGFSLASLSGRFRDAVDTILARHTCSLET